MAEHQPQINGKSELPKNNVLRVATIIFIAAIIVAAFYFFLAWQLDAWQMYALASVITAFVIASFFAIRAIRSGNENRGVWIVIVGMYVVFPLAVTLIAEIGLIFAGAVFLLTYLVSSQTLPPKQNRLAIFMAILAAIGTAAIDYLKLDYRLVVPQIKAFVPGITGVIALVIGFFVIRRAWAGNLRTKLITSFLAATILPLLIVGTIVSYQTYNTLLPQTLNAQEQISKRIAGQVENFIRERETELRLLVDVANLASRTTDEQTELLASLLSTQDLYDELVLVNGNGQELIYLSRLDIVTPSDLTNRAGSEEYEKVRATKQTYFSPVLFNELSGEPYMVIAVPLIDLRTGNLVYELIANLRFKAVWNLMAEADAGDGIVYMIDSNQRVVAHANPSVVLQGTRVNLPPENAFTTGINGVDVAMARTHINLSGQEFDVIAEIPQAKATALATTNLITTIGVVFLMILLASSFGTFAARLITNPIGELASVAHEISNGNFTKTVNVNSEDEIGELGTAFNSMTGQLRGLVGSLEERVTERTAALEESSAQIEKRAFQLEAISDVSSSIASLQDVNELLPYITQLVSERFNFYHVGIFLLSDDKEFAVLRAANSEGGKNMLARKHQLRVGQEGIVGFAISQKRAHIVLDVGEDRVYFNNPDLPSTHSEMALPLMIGGNAIGALDVQSEQPNAFSNEDIDILSILANQVAVAIENARLFQQSQDALKELDNTFQRYIRSEWKQFAARSKIIGYRAAESGLEPITDKQNSSETKNGNQSKLNVPILLRGTAMGSLQIDMGKRSQEYSDEEKNLIQTVADRLALALESARLLEESQRAAAKEQVIGEITGKIGSSINLRNVLQTAVEELGQVIPGSEIVIQLTPKQEA